MGFKLQPELSQEACGFVAPEFCWNAELFGIWNEHHTGIRYWARGVYIYLWISWVWMHKYAFLSISKAKWSGQTYPVESSTIHQGWRWKGIHTETPTSRSFILSGRLGRIPKSSTKEKGKRGKYAKQPSNLKLTKTKQMKTNTNKTTKQPTNQPNKQQMNMWLKHFQI